MTCDHGLLHMVRSAPNMFRSAPFIGIGTPRQATSPLPCMEECQCLAAALVAPYMNDGRIVNLLAKAFEPDYDPPKAGRSTIDFPEAQLTFMTSTSTAIIDWVLRSDLASCQSSRSVKEMEARRQTAFAEDKVITETKKLEAKRLPQKIRRLTFLLSWRKSSFKFGYFCNKVSYAPKIIKVLVSSLVCNPS
ncbi:hypothetical protein C8R48DRAFT_829367 [Suillus tomentosus]|nr:hypothetical protein C8R48DRAFT_829367 [Suillus tomentosus]